MNVSKGFTVLELLIAISIMGILASITIPNIERMRQNAENAKTEKEMKSIYTALVMFQGFNGRMPQSLSELVPGYINVQNIEAKYELNLG